MPEEEGTIKGKIIFGNDASFNNALVHIKLLDASYADAPTKLITEKTIYFAYSG